MKSSIVYISLNTLTYQKKGFYINNVKSCRYNLTSQKGLDQYQLIQVWTILWRQSVSTVTSWYPASQYKYQQAASVEVMCIITVRRGNSNWYQTFRLFLFWSCRDNSHPPYVVSDVYLEYVTEDITVDSTVYWKIVTR